MKIRKNDQVVVIKGKDKGKKSKVLRGFPEKGMVLVEGVNVKKKHKKPRKEGEKGQVIEVALPVPVGKIKLICPKCKKAVKVGYKIAGDIKHRVCKKCGEEI